MADGLQKIGVPKPSVFATVNGNAAAHNNCSPVVAPKFKISRGTQANSVVPKNVTKLSPSPPVPAKPAALSKQPKLPAPPVPPKPGSASKAPSPTKPAVAVKPALPPKPLVRLCNSGPPSREPIVVSPTRPQRSSRDHQPLHVDQEEKSIPMFQDIKLPINSAQLAVKHYSSRKSASLGRIEGRCCALLVRETDERCLQRDSGFISCSLENVGQSTSRIVNHYTDIPVVTSPIAPPRRRRKSADNYEPIYAVVDFSKKRNRRFLITQDQPTTGGNLVQPVVKLLTDTEAQDVGSKPIEETVPTFCRDFPQLNDGEDASSLTTDYASLEACSLNETITSSQMDSDIEMIENSFATIASLIESFNQTADNAKAPRSTVTKDSDNLRNDVSASVKHQPEEASDVGQTVIARLVFGGTVVQQTDLLPVIFISSTLLPSQITANLSLS